ncbi:phosphate ABC transporter substrate-binding protein PstS family protein [Parafannyhessea umbonata]|uniref:Phosphate ABC transporter substrate-binding protein, PhoT family n=1 Tax=Parafannyhessea umbonata TaxID=604330 RepID=A0A1H1KY95_9ACTN|nr:phosphate ABC transporter substrate-binding protein PstS family protein [Parafannyhessea umbonata]SDR67243.1 phosphate ABC transporter substrate-binding protein, PhoT family [Parafannyhessea umbonata]
MSHSMSRRKFVTISGASLAATLGLGLAACGGSSDSDSDASKSGSSSDKGKEVSGNITAVGSTALQPLVEAAAEQYMNENPGVQITVQGGGSGQGITQIAQGAVQIGNSDVFAEEKLENKDDAKKLKDNKVAVVGMGPVVHPDVKVDDLTIDQLKGIFTGKVTNWREVGGGDKEIVVINRAAGSGTRATFENAVLGGDKVPEDFRPQEQDSSGTVVKMVAQTPNSISYLAFSYFSDDVKALKVGGVEPKDENVETNDWTIWAYEHMYTAAKPDAATADFIKYMLSDDVQGSLVKKTGYISTKGMKVERDADGNVKKL